LSLLTLLIYLLILTTSGQVARWLEKSWRLSSSAKSSTGIATTNCISYINFAHVVQVLSVTLYPYCSTKFSWWIYGIK